MTGPEHYRMAEALIKTADEGSVDWEPTVAAAQVHALLALTAARVDGTAMRQEDRTEWDRAMGRPEVTR